MSEQENVARFRRVIEAGFSRGDVGVLDELMAADCIEHQRGLPPGRGGARKTIETLHGWMSDFELRVVEIVAAGDMVWSLNRATGINTGAIMGNPPTGKPCEIDVIDIVRFKDGRIVEHWGIADQLGMLIQLGLIPARPPVPVP